MTDSLGVGLVAVALLLLLSGLVDVARNGRPFDPRECCRGPTANTSAPPTTAP